MEYSIKPKRLGERRIIHYPQKRIIGLYVDRMKNPLIKICGITSEEEIRYIAKAGIDYAGFVLFFPKSKRNLSLELSLIHI